MKVLGQLWSESGVTLHLPHLLPSPTTANLSFSGLSLSSVGLWLPCSLAICRPLTFLYWI